MTDAWHSMRASDADRERAADVIKAALAEGRITLEEHHSRLSQAMNARTYGQLEQAVRYLPTGITPQPPAAPPAVPQPYGSHPYASPPAYPPARQTNSLAFASAVMGGLGFVTGISAIGAIMTGRMALSRIRHTGEDGRGLAVAGLVMGYLVTAGAALLLLAGMMFLFTGVS